MAKLSARGRKELLRLSREEGTPRTDGWRRVTRAYTDDRTVLEKVDWWVANVYERGRVCSTGWKLAGKLKEKDGLAFDALLAAISAKRVGDGWRVVTR